MRNKNILIANIPYGFIVKCKSLDWTSFKLGISHSFPICFAFVFMYASLGMLGRSRGIDLKELVAMSATIFAAPLQAIIISNSDSSILNIAINALIINFRFLLMSTVLLQLWKKNVLTIPSLHFICSSTYMVCSTQKLVNDPWAYFVGISIPSYFTAILSTVLGYMLWEIGVEYQSFLHALSHVVLPIHFICLNLKRKKEKIIIFSFVLGLVLTPVLHSVVGNKFIVLLWLVIAWLIVMLEEKYYVAKNYYC